MLGYFFTCFPETFLETVYPGMYLPPQHVLVISNLISGKNKLIQCGTEYLGFNTVSKLSVIVGAKWMV